jgi:hypothetical protein
MFINCDLKLQTEISRKNIIEFIKKLVPNAILLREFNG